MSHPVPAPTFDETLYAGAIACWHVADGATVEKEQPLCDIEIDKATVEILSPTTGTLHIRTAEGEACNPNETIAHIGTETDSDQPNPEHKPRAPFAPVPSLIQEETPDIASGPPEPLNAMRATLARRMTESKLSAPHFYLTTIADMSACLALRKELKAQKIRATYNDMILKAAGLALRKFPRVASVFTAKGYLPRDRMNVGFAVATEPEGLVVPVIRDADKKSLADIALATKAMIEKARKKQLTPHDYAEGVFSISNLGTFEVDQFTAIVNPGEAAILAIGKITDMPCAVKGTLAIRPLMKFTLSSDHRVIDGLLAARFNSYIKSLLEDPSQLVP